MANQKQILGALTFILLGAILFTPQNSETWRIPFVLGMGSGIFYFFKK